MPATRRQIVTDLRLLGHYLRVGMAKLHPATERELNAAREAVRHQWERRQRLAQRQTKAKTATQSQTKPVEQPQPTAEERRRQHAQDQGYSH